MTFRFDDKARQAVADALLEVSPACHDKVERAIADVEQAIDRYLFAKASKKERPSEAKKSLMQRLRSSKPLSRIIDQCRPQERAWLRMAQASAQLRGLDPNDKEVLAGRLKSIVYRGAGLPRCSQDLAFDLLLRELLDIFTECTGARPTWRDNWYAREMEESSRGEGEPMSKRSCGDSNALPLVRAAIEGASLDGNPERIRHHLGEARKNYQALLNA